MSHFIIKQLEERNISKSSIDLNRIISGVVLKVTYSGIQSDKKVNKVITGLCIGVQKNGYSSSIRIINVIDNVFVEFSFLIYSPSIVNIEISSLKRKRFKKAKLYFLKKV